MTFFLSNGSNWAYKVSQSFTFSRHPYLEQRREMFFGFYPSETHSCASTNRPGIKNTIKPLRLNLRDFSVGVSFFKYLVKRWVFSLWLKTKPEEVHSTTLGPVQRRNESWCMSFSVFRDGGWYWVVLVACRGTWYRHVTSVFVFKAKLQCFILKTRQVSGLCGEKWPNPSDLHDWERLAWAENASPRR